MARSLLYFVVGLLIGAGAVAMVTGAGPVDIAVSIDNQSLTDSQPDNGAATTPQKTEAEDSGLLDISGDSSIDKRQLAFAIHAQINEERTQRGLSRLRMDPELRAIANNHSQDMAERDYFAHESPDGDNFGDRYDAAGYQCRVSTDSSQFATGAENIAFQTTYETNETELANAIVSQWMASDGHRENILQNHWEHEGIGIAVGSEDGMRKIYATQNFC